jgi:hypothetical protein
MGKIREISKKEDAKTPSGVLSKGRSSVQIRAGPPLSRF